MLLALLAPLLLAPWSVAAIDNAAVMIDMVQNNPGDPVGWEQSKYFDPSVLKELGYTGKMPRSGLLAEWRLRPQSPRTER